MSKINAKAEKTINDLKVKKAETLASAEKRLEDAKKDMAEAEAALQRATVSGTPEDYSAAKRARAEAADKVELYTARLNGLRETGGIVATDAEIAALSEEIRKNVLSESDKAKKYIVSVLSEMMSMIDDLQEDFKDGQTMISTLNQEIGKKKFTEFVTFQPNEYDVLNYMIRMIEQAKNMNIIPK